MIGMEADVSNVFGYGQIVQTVSGKTGYYLCITSRFSNPCHLSKVTQFLPRSGRSRFPGTLEGEMSRQSLCQSFLPLRREKLVSREGFQVSLGVLEAMEVQLANPPV